MQRVLWDSQYEQIDIVIFVIDASDRFRFDEAESELIRILADPTLKLKPILILFHKFDLETAVSLIGKIRSRIMELIKDREIPILNTSIIIPETIEKLLKVINKLI